MYTAYAGGGPPHYAPPTSYLQPPPPPPPPHHHVQMPPAMGQEPNPVAHYSKKRRYIIFLIEFFPFSYVCT